eukprot:5596145-Alexandrium_andersonii.AAC.1
MCLEPQLFCTQYICPEVVFHVDCSGYGEETDCCIWNLLSSLHWLWGGECAYLWLRGGARPTATVRIARQTSITGMLVGVAIKLIARVPCTWNDSND